LGGVSAKRMFGAYGIYKDDLIFGIVAGEKLYLKTDDENRPAFEDAGMEPFSFTEKNGQVMTMKYHEAPEAIFNSPMRMKPWAMSAYQAAQRNAAKKKPNKKRHAGPR
ncbi:MAG TPA: TfoX/Sxy family protein, partial [Prosthecobacter sp.]|nr:TfoX/Sxy family protein [Prosthecobacter sp.]